MFLSVSCLLAVLATPPAPSPLAARLQPLIQAHKGQVAVGVKHLETGETFFHNPDLVLPTASLIKVTVLIEAYPRPTRTSCPCATPTATWPLWAWISGCSR